MRYFLESRRKRIDERIFVRVCKNLPAVYLFQYLEQPVPRVIPRCKGYGAFVLYDLARFVCKIALFGVPYPQNGYERLLLGLGDFVDSRGDCNDEFVFYRKMVAQSGRGIARTNDAARKSCLTA